MIDIFYHIFDIYAINALSSDLLRASLNLTAILLLQSIAFIALKDYEYQKRLYINPIFHPDQLNIKNATYWDSDRAEKNLVVEESQGVDNLNDISKVRNYTN